MSPIQQDVLREILAARAVDVIKGHVAGDPNEWLDRPHAELGDETPREVLEHSDLTDAASLIMRAAAATTNHPSVRH